MHKYLLGAQRCRRRFDRRSFEKAFSIPLAMCLAGARLCTLFVGRGQAVFVWGWCGVMVQVRQN